MKDEILEVKEINEKNDRINDLYYWQIFLRNYYIMGRFERENKMKELYKRVIDEGYFKVKYKKVDDVKILVPVEFIVKKERK